jgi:hypothetical protein
VAFTPGSRILRSILSGMGPPGDECAASAIVLRDRGRLSQLLGGPGRSVVGYRRNMPKPQIAPLC